MAGLQPAAPMKQGRDVGAFCSAKLIRFLQTAVAVSIPLPGCSHRLQPCAPLVVLGPISAPWGCTRAGRSGAELHTPAPSPKPSTAARLLCFGSRLQLVTRIPEVFLGRNPPSWRALERIWPR